MKIQFVTKQSHDMGTHVFANIYLAAETILQHFRVSAFGHMVICNIERKVSRDDIIESCSPISYRNICNYLRTLTGGR